MAEFDEASRVIKHAPTAKCESNQQLRLFLKLLSYAVGTHRQWEQSDMLYRFKSEG